MSTTETGTVSMALHEEFEKCIDNLNNAIERRLSTLEHANTTMQDLLTTVARLATSMEAMASEQHDQRDQIHEVYTAVTNINIEYVERKLNEHDDRFDNYSRRIRELENRPQDSEDCENRLRAVEAHVHSTGGHGSRINQLERRVDGIEREPAEMFKKIKWAILAAVCSGAGMAIWGGIQMLASKGV